jgi:BirA family biotin operon repressor/biotin-[acetyl-CoA-carboxylase] ligase
LNEKEHTTSPHLDLDILQRLIATHVFGSGHRCIYLPTVESTNTQALYLAHNGSEEGVVVLTDSQTAGKGRLGRNWIDRAGCNVLSSTILYPSFPLYFLVMMASLAVVDAIADTCDVPATIKWPNDVLIEDKKVCGILIETRMTPSGRMAAIVGIGVNVNGNITSTQSANAETLAMTATTLEAACGQRVSREQFIARLLHHLEEMYLPLQQATQNNQDAPIDELPSRAIQRRWRSRLSTLGRTITVQQGNNVLSGIAEDVSDSGELFLRCHSGEGVRITWGDIGYPTE